MNRDEKEKLHLRDLCKKLLGWEVIEYKNIDKIEVIDEEGYTLVLGEDFDPYNNLIDVTVLLEGLKVPVEITTDGEDYWEATINEHKSGSFKLSRAMTGVVAKYMGIDK